MRDPFNIIRLLSLSILLLLHSFSMAGMGEDVNANVQPDGRSFSLEVPGLIALHSGFSVELLIAGECRKLDSSSGTLVDAIRSEKVTTPYGMADETRTTIRFEREQVDLTLCLTTIPEMSVVLLHAGIKNNGSHSVEVQSLSPLEMGGAAPEKPPALDERGVIISGKPEEWLITGLNANTPELATLAELDEMLLIEEQGSFYRSDGSGFLFGPVGQPTAYVSAMVVPLTRERVGLSLWSRMGSVRVEPGQSRWGQQMAIFVEPPQVALMHWAEWVAKTHGSRTGKGALSGWNSWYHLKQAITGQNVLDVVDQVKRSKGHLRPDVIQIDRGYAAKPDMSLETNEKFPEGLSFYAQRISATGVRPGLRLELTGSATQNLAIVRQAVDMGFTYLKMTYNYPTQDVARIQTPFEIARKSYQAIRATAGEECYILDCDGRMEPKSHNRAVVGFADASRSGPDTFRQGVREVMEEVLRAYSLNNRWFAIDNDCYYMATELKDVNPVVGGWPLSRTWISLVGLSCGAAFTSDPWGEERFKLYWRNVEILTPPAKERSDVLDIGTSKEWSSVVGNVRREWGSWTVALLWNPLEKEQRVTLDFHRIGLDSQRRYAVWSFWDNRYLGVAEGSYTTPFLAPSASQHLCFTELPATQYKAVVIGSNLHIYCGAAEIKRVISLRSALQIELTDAGAREGEVFVYSRFRPVVNESIGCVVEGIKGAGENAWQISVRGRQGEVQRIELGIPLPVTYQRWFWGMCVVLVVSLVYSGWRFVAWQQSQLVLSRLEQTTSRQQERARIARDLHDELGASLAQIAMLGNRAQRLSPGDAGQQARLAEIYERARESARRLDEIVWAVNPARDSLEHLVSYLCKFAEEYLALAEIRFRIDIPDDLPVVPLDSGLRHNIFLAAREAIHNAVQHGHPKTVTLRVVVEAALFTVAIMDDGQGFDVAAALAAGRGVANMSIRMTKVGGEAQMRSTLGVGSTVCFIIPLTVCDRRLHSYE